MELQAAFRQAVAFLQQGQFTQAERICESVLRQQPGHFDALHMLGVISAQTGRPERAVQLIGQAIRLNGRVPAAHSHLGNALKDLGRREEAIASYDRAIALKPDSLGAFYSRGNALRELGRAEEALASYERAIALKPDFAEAHAQRGNTLRDLRRPAEALAGYDRAITLRPDYAEACYNRGLVLQELRRREEALASYDRAIALDPGNAEAHSNRGVLLQELGRRADALASYDRAIALKPDYAEAFSNRGVVLQDFKRPEEALASYDRAIALRPDYAGAHYNRGNLFNEWQRYDEAIAAFDRALSLDPHLARADSARLHAKMQICDWTDFDADCRRVVSSIRDGTVNPLPFLLLALPSSSADQLQCSRLWVATKHPPSEKPVWQGERYDHDRIRVAYVSADFHRHATSWLMAGMIERHDRSRFEVTGISIGADDRSELRQRLAGAFERFIDAQTYSDARIASLIRELEIDVLVDLKGFTMDARTNIFAARPAPIQVNYLGYPGTMGAPYIDYIVADGTVVPETDRAFYSEKIVTLPNTYQVNDDRREISDEALTRAGAGLPEAGFVFCCFNNSYKITPHVFDRWMRILGQVEGSVLWLLEGNPRVAGNLRSAAAARGISGERLIFAKPLPMPEHLARHRLADLFLDTLPYNAHTTASDALWTGLPVLTCPGETFAGRVAASLLDAIRLPELIAATPEAYEHTAVALATRPDRLVAIKRKLADNRLTTPLFNTVLFTKHIEASFTAMHERQLAGLPPDHILVR
jgi:predicted O-linked N-acetylglucosamine transferase (SPINDLY family)